MSRIAVRAPSPAEWGSARVFVGDWASATGFHARALEILGDALERPSDEQEVIAAFEGAALRGAAVIGFVAGAEGTGRILFLASDGADASLALARAAARALRSRGARLVIAEWADEPPFTEQADVLREAGWHEAGRIADLVRDGVDATILVAPALPA